MKYVTLFLLANALFAQEAPKSPPASASPLVSTTTNKSVIVIDPKARANDYVQAFDFLRKDKPTLKIAVHTTSAAIQNVTDITATSGGTLLLLKIFSNQGTRTQIVPVEEIMEINYSP